MTHETEATMSLLAALLVLFSAMIEPRLSIALAILLLVAFSAYLFMESRRVR